MNQETKNRYKTTQEKTASHYPINFKYKFLDIDLSPITQYKTYQQVNRNIYKRKS